MLREIRRGIRLALVHAELHHWDEVISICLGIYSQHASGGGEVTFEVRNLLASLANTTPSDLRRNAAMRAAAVRRLEETKTLIGESLVTITDH